ncbi:unnamed protein product [Polarella glacialis]|uniref:Ketoreductase (KR) domain-containing protein n=1 Tax=Polarella glacialis TaxID=89957 RepID=A0A813HYJ6_POLGL|nr:unnamed protein product [Polarella glacialis]
MGLVIAREMAAQGHSPVVTVSRTGRTSMPADALQELDVIQEYIAHHDVRCDLSDASSVSDVIARYQGSLGPVRREGTAGGKIMVLRLGGATGPDYGDLDALQVYSRMLERLRKLANEPGEVSQESLNQWERIGESLSKALVSFKDFAQGQPYSQEQHRGMLTLEDMESEMGALIGKLSAKLLQA